MVIYVTAAPFDLRQRLNEGIALFQQGRLEESWQAINQVLGADPNNATAWQIRGLILVQAGQAKAAVADFQRAVRFAPSDPVAHNNLGNALRDNGDVEGALQSCERALALAPDFEDARLSRANALLDLGRPAEAIADYDWIIQRRPGLAKAHNNRGMALRSLNRSDLALESFERAMALDPHWVEIRANAGFAYLAVGDLAKGFALFEWRWHHKTMAANLASRQFQRPFWRGEEPLQGRTLLLHSEQGFGDVFQFCRYAALAQARGARVVLEAAPSAAALLRSLKGVDQVVAQGEPLPDFDLHCPVMSLPHAFGTTLDTIPGETPYLKADPALVSAWAQRLGPLTRPRIGLVWSSGVRPDQPELKAVNGRRDMPFDKLKAFKGLPVTFYSLQKGEPAEGAFAALDQSAWDGPPIVNLAPQLHDWSQTAAVLENLDLLVSVDTATPHLAGALGRPAWIMNRFDPCWRWLQGRPDSPWYPTLRLFRQPRMGDWDTVVAEVAEALRAEFASA